MRWMNEWMNENLLNLNKVCSPKKKKSTFPSNHSIQSIHQSNPMKIYPCIEEKGIHTHTLLPEQQQQFFFLHAARIQCQCLIQTTHTITKKKKKNRLSSPTSWLNMKRNAFRFFSTYFTINWFAYTYNNKNTTSSSTNTFIW